VHMIETINKLIRTSRALVQDWAANRHRRNRQRMDIPVSKVRKVLKIAQEPIHSRRQSAKRRTRSGDFIEDRQVVSPAEA